MAFVTLHRFGWVGATVLLMAACSDSSLELPDGSNAQSGNVVEGSWETTCAAAAGGFGKTKLTFEGGGGLTNEQTTHTAADCSAETVVSTRTESFRYWVIAKVNETEEKYKINLQSTRLVFLPTETQAAAWNQSGFCDHAEWKAGEEFERTDKTCHTKVLSFDLIKVENNILFFGSKTGGNSGTSNETRPILVDTNGFVKI